MTWIFLLGVWIGFIGGFALASIYLAGKVRQAENALEEFEQYATNLLNRRTP